MLDNQDIFAYNFPFWYEKPFPFPHTGKMFNRINFEINGKEGMKENKVNFVNGNLEKENVEYYI